MGKFQYRKFQAFDEDHSTEVLPQKEEKDVKKDVKESTEEEIKKESEEKLQDTPVELEEQEDEPEEELPEEVIKEVDEKSQDDLLEEKKIPEESEESTDGPIEEPTDETVKEPEKENNPQVLVEGPNPKKEQLRLELTTPLIENSEANETETENSEENLEEEPDLSEYKVPFLEKLKKEKKEKKSKPPKQKKPRKVYLTKEMQTLLGRLGLLIMGCLIVIVGTLYWISPLNTLQEITVTGNQQLTKEEIIKTSGLIKDESLWPQVFKKNKVPDKLKKSIPEIKNATVSFEPLNHLIIEAKEYQINALLKEGESYFPVLENGYVRRTKAVPSNGDYPVLVDFKETKDILNFLKIYHQLPKEIVELIEEIHFTGTKEDPNQLTLKMSDGNQVIARLSTLLQYLPKYPQVASQMKEKGIVDMEAGVFSYPYGNEERIKAKKEKEQSENKNNETAPDSEKEEKTEEKNKDNFIPDITQLPGQKENH